MKDRNPLTVSTYFCYCSLTFTSHCQIKPQCLHQIKVESLFEFILSVNATSSALGPLLQEALRNKHQQILHQFLVRS